VSRWGGLRKPRYQFLSRKQREAVDWATEKLLLDLLESGEVGAFNTIVGVIQDLKDVAARVSEDQERCLRLPLVLFEAAVKPK
jgi:hypothetical protein